MPSRELEAHVEEGTNDFGGLALGQVFIKRQYLLRQGNELVKQTLLTEDAGQFVRSLLLGPHGLIIDIILALELVLDNALVDRDGVTLIVFLLVFLALVKFFG